jgi:hypothetical protein
MPARTCGHPINIKPPPSFRQALAEQALAEQALAEQALAEPTAALYGGSGHERKAAAGLCHMQILGLLCSN